MTNRQAITQFRTKLKERNADTSFSNQFLFRNLSEHRKWLVKREVSSGRIYKNNSIFQPLKGREVIEVSTIPSCLNILTNCKIYRTKNKLPEMWSDETGPIMKLVASVDNSTQFNITTITNWQNKINDPYQQLSKALYVFFFDGYLWFPQVNPHRVNIIGFFQDDISNEVETCSDCQDEKKECIRFLDRKFIVPDWVEAEMFAKAIEQILGTTSRINDDNQIDKNPTRKN